MRTLVGRVWQSPGSGRSSGRPPAARNEENRQRALTQLTGSLVASSQVGVLPRFVPVQRLDNAPLPSRALLWVNHQAQLAVLLEAQALPQRRTASRDEARISPGARQQRTRVDRAWHPLRYTYPAQAKEPEVPERLTATATDLPSSTPAQLRRRVQECGSLPSDAIRTFRTYPDSLRPQQIQLTENKESHYASQNNRRHASVDFRP
jgi:hypothetical protein